MARKFRPFIVATALGAGVTAGFALADQPLPIGGAAPIGFTAAQASEGAELYATACAACHGPALEGGSGGRPLKGRTFLGRWGGGGNSLGAMFKYIRDKMPPGGGGTLQPDQVTPLVALILSENGIKPGAAPLPADHAALQKLRLPYAGDTSGGLSLQAKLPPWPAKPNPAASLSPVTDAMLREPPPGDWLTWRRTQDGQGFSPLTQVGKANVAGLRLVWSYNLSPGPNAATPLVHDGVIFVYSNRDQVDALNAATGEVLWTYRHEPRQTASRLPPRVKRNMALYGDRLYTATGDNRMIALDARTGALVWESETGPASGGPLAASGMVLEGLFRGERTPAQASTPADPAKPTCATCGGIGRIMGLDAASGAKLWTFNVIPQAGEAGENSWNGLPVAERSGGSVWTSGFYDPALDLAFFGTGNTYNTAPLAKPIGKPGVSNDALYTDTTLAFRPRTGKLAWHFQHQPNDQWDLDWAFERMILPLTVDGKRVKAVVTAGKMAIVDALDAQSGKYLFSVDAGLQNVVKRIDPATGRKETDPDLVPGEGRTAVVCPAQNGAKNWIPGSFDAATATLFLPLNAACMEMEPVEAGETSPLSSGIRWSLVPRPDSDGRYGRVQAIDLASRKTRWIAQQRAPMTSGVLGTAGGLVFAGGLDRVFSAYDANDGKLLWSARLGDVPSGAPVSFAVDGKQYVAVVAGYGTMLSGGYLSLVPEIPVPATPSSSIYVFALPDPPAESRVLAANKIVALVRSEGCAFDRIEARLAAIANKLAADPRTTRVVADSPADPLRNVDVAGRPSPILAALEVSAPAAHLPALAEAVRDGLGNDCRSSVYLIDERRRMSTPRTWREGLPSPGGKVLNTLIRKSGLTTESFVEEWTVTHAELALAWRNTEGRPGSRYVQNIVVAQLGSVTPDLDGIGEIEANVPATEAVREGRMKTARHAPVFTDTAKAGMFTAREVILKGE